MHWLRDMLGPLTLVGDALTLATLALVRNFARLPADNPRAAPPVTILKPVYGGEILLEEALESFCRQDYANFQLIIGAQDPNDPALAVARRVRAKYPRCDIQLVAAPALHGPNRKISNLINMMPHAKHEVLVFADSDLHVDPDYLRQVVATLEKPGTGLVTTLNAGEPAANGLAGRLGASHITHSFLPSALLAFALGRQDCLGTTMALKRDTLARAGGLEGLVGHLADDNVLGVRVNALGLAVRLAKTVPVVTVQEHRLRQVWQHELRWARTIRALEPANYAGSSIQFPIAFGMLAMLLSGGATWSVSCFVLAWATRAGAAVGTDHFLRRHRARRAPRAPIWLLPLRDLMSVAEIISSFLGHSVVWRGHHMRAKQGLLVPAGFPPAEAVPAYAQDETLAA